MDLVKTKSDLMTMVKKGYLSFLILVLIMITLPLQHRYLPPLMILLGIFWLLEIYLGLINPLKSSLKYRVLFFLFLIFYIWQLIGILYSSDVKMGWANLYGRLSLIIFPMIMFNPAERVKTKNNLLLKVFTLSTSVYIIACFIYAFIRSLSLNNGTWLFNPHPQDFFWLNYFFGMDFTFSIHPSYLAMYVLLSFFIATEAGNDRSLILKYRIFWIILGIFLLISLYFISSRAGLLAAFILIPVYAIYKIIKIRKSKVFWIIIVLMIIPVLALVIKNNTRIKSLFKDISDEHKSEITINDDRLKIWKSALTIIEDNFVLGVGIGDVRTELVKEYDRQGEQRLSDERLNAHNQFLEVFLENGIIGLVIFLGLMSFMAYLAISEENLLYSIFIIMMIVYFMFETILYRLAGVSFFSLFSFLLLYYKSDSQAN